MIKLTPEQFESKEHLVHEDGMILVSAGPGTGKTFLAEQVINALSPAKVLYTAFNKAIVESGKKRFGTNLVECKTLHSLAYRYSQPKGEIRSTNYRDLPNSLTYGQKYEVLQAIESFFVSASSDMWEFFEDYFGKPKNRPLLIQTSLDTVHKMLDKELPWSFSFMLKYFHLMLIEDPKVCHYDLVILDEINDTTAVALEIFKLLDAPKKLGIGDPHQAIYSFMNLVNGFEELKDIPIYSLTQSFRCSKEIAYKIEQFMQSYVSSDFKFTGSDTPVENGKSLYCTMTNGSIIKELAYRLGEGKSFKLLRKPADIFACSLAVLSASNEREIYQSQYKYLQDVFNDWKSDSSGKYKSFFSYVLKKLDDSEVHSAVRLLLGLQRRNINLFDIYKKVKSHKQQDDYTIATVYTAKGLEFETVTLAEEFDSLIAEAKQAGEENVEKQQTLFKCFYVAASRAGRILNNANELSR